MSRANILSAEVSRVASRNAVRAKDWSSSEEPPQKIRSIFSINKAIMSDFYLGNMSTTHTTRSNHCWKSSTLSSTYERSVKLASSDLMKYLMSAITKEKDLLTSRCTSHPFVQDDFRHWSKP